MAKRRVRKNKHCGMNKKHGKKPMSSEQKAENKKAREEMRARTLKDTSSKKKSKE